MKQYWIKIRYSDGVERWELTGGRFANEQAVLKSYKPRTRSMDGTILAVKPHEQFEFKYNYVLED